MPCPLIKTINGFDWLIESPSLMVLENDCETSIEMIGYRLARLQVANYFRDFYSMHSALTFISFWMRSNAPQDMFKYLIRM